jgi:DNA repair exonuclease SbcCD ATPase subunit
MSTRVSVLASASSLVSRARSLEAKRSELLQEIESLTQRIESQNREGGLIANVLQRSDLPSLRETTTKLTRLKAAIQEEQRQQTALKRECAQLQEGITAGISLREKQTQYDRFATELKALASRLEEERKRETTLKFQQTQLLSEQLKARLRRKRLEEQLAADATPLLDLTPLNKKKKSLLDQMRHLRTKREAFEQELIDTVDELEQLRSKRTGLKEMADRTESIDPTDLQRQILQAAAENMELRAYRPVPQAAEDLLTELARLAESCASLLDRAQLVIE